MALGTWWNGDPLPDLPTLPSFCACLSHDKQLIAYVTTLSMQEIEARLHDGNHVYLAFLDQTPVAYGWLARHVGRVDEIGLSFTIPPRNRYLWDFLTLPAWRGRGIYPHFLQTIIHQEQHEVDRFWIMYAPGNDTAARSIRRAGFLFVGELTFTQHHVSGLSLFNTTKRAYAGAALLDLPALPPYV